ncbi:MAG: hypothetical protein JWQ64_2210 [Subtercola sp.]|nr:hypothetical protein [Subtercola sp.]
MAVRSTTVGGGRALRSTAVNGLEAGGPPNPAPAQRR